MLIKPVWKRRDNGNQQKQHLSIPYECHVPQCYESTKLFILTGQGQFLVGLVSQGQVIAMQQEMFCLEIQRVSKYLGFASFYWDLPLLDSVFGTWLNPPVSVICFADIKLYLFLLSRFVEIGQMKSGLLYGIIKPL